MNRKDVTIQERAFLFACNVIALHDDLAFSHGSARVIRRQLLRSATSIGANLEEASSAQSKADFLSKCSVAAKEARETHYWLRLLTACRGIAPHRVAPLVTEANELVSIVTTIVKKAAANPSRAKSPGP